jgi:formamidopyrimidine-DNA glycosylase
VPELPEVETVVRELRPDLLGRRITGIEAGRKRLRRQWSRRWEPLLLGRTVDSIRRRGKWIVIECRGGVCLLMHLGMTGQLLVRPAATQRVAHTHLVFQLDRGRHELRFRDVRRFGCATVWTSPAQLEQFFEDSGLGPEPFELKAGYWQQRLAATKRCLKAVLLDQRVVAGVGNIYADESLFHARLHPWRLACHLEAGEAGRLRRALVTVLNRAIDQRGSSIRDYVGGSGEQGGYQNEFRVYGRTGEPCPRCGAPIECIRLAGRSTHFCPACQPVSRNGGSANRR